MEGLNAAATAGRAVDQDTIFRVHRTFILDVRQPAQALEQQRVMGAALVSEEAGTVAAQPGDVVAAAADAGRAAEPARAL